MLRLDDVATRIGTRVAELSGRIQRAPQFAELLQQGRTPNVTPAAFVLPGGIDGGQVVSASGQFIQGTAETVMVVLMFRVADAIGPAGLDEATPVVKAVIAAIAGWGPDDAPGVFALGRADFTGSEKGLLVFQIDFTLQDQLRINVT